jgi:hypothetical protein
MRPTWLFSGSAAIATTLALGACGGGKNNSSTTASTGAASTTGTTTGSGGGGTGGGGTGGGPVTPTVSSWLGTNVAADLPRVDVAYQLNPFDTPAAMKDANGYPVAGAGGKSGTDIGFVLPSGTYDIAFKGGGTLQVGGIGKLVGSWTTVSGEQRSTVQITGTPGAFGNFLNLTIVPTPGQTVTALRILYPGFDYATTQVFLPQFLGLLAPFRALRFMDWEKTNGSTLASFANRPAASSFGASPNGEPWEHIVELVNETGKDFWLTVPEHATDAFVHSLAQLLAQGLDHTRIAAARAKQGFSTPFQIIVENSNETWNMGFTAYATFLAAAKANPTRYTGAYTGTYGPSWMSGNTDLMRVGQYEADRLAQIAAIFRQELMASGFSSAVAPVLSGWALGAVYSDVGLRFLKDNVGDPKTIVTYVALAPYFAPPDDSTTGALATLFQAANANITSYHANFQDFAKLASDWGIEVAAYEGGQSLTGTTNQPIKHLAQHDARMYLAYLQYFAQWKQDLGGSLFMHFSLAGDPGLPENIYQYGYWGSIIGALEDPKACSPNLPMLMGTEAIPSVVHHCPKYRALMEQVP